MGQAIEQGGGHAFALEDLSPFAEGQVAGEQDAGPFVPVGKDLEQQFRACAAEGQIAKFVTDQQVRLVQAGQKAIELVLLLGFLELVDQVGGGEEAYAFAAPARGQSEADGQMRFPRAGIADQTGVEVLVNPLASGQLQHLLLVQRRQRGEVEVVQVLENREAGLLDAHLQGVALPGRHFQLGQSQQVLLVVLVGGGGFASQLLELATDRG